MTGNDGTLKFDTKIDSSGFQKGVDALGKGLSVTGKVLGGVATGVTALGGAAVKVGSDFESGMSQVQAVSGASGEELERLKEKAKEMGASTKFSATESAEALNYMAMAGWKTEDMLGGIEGIMNLAAASGEDLASTSDIVTDALTAFGMSASDSTHFADILAAASSNANTNVGMMGETFKYVAPLAGSLGYSAEDTATAIGLMANAGIKGSQAGTSLRSIMTRLAKPTKDSQMAMDALGLSITDSTGKMKPLSEIVADMREGFSGLTEDEKASYAAMLGGQEAMSGLLAIVNATDADFKKLSGAINDCNGSAAEMAEIMQDNLQGQITILKSGLEGLGVSLYETMQDTAKDVVKEAQGMVQQLQDAFNEGGFQGLVGAFGGVLAQIVQRIAEAAPMVIEAAVSLVMSFCDGLKSAPGIGESGASLITSLVTGLMSCVGEIWTTSIVLIGKLAEGIAAGAPQMVQAASMAIADIVEGIVDWLPDILQAGADIIVALAEGIADALPTLIYQAANIVTEIAIAVVENLPVLVDAALQLVMGLVQGFVEGAPLLLEGAIELFMAILEALPVVIEQLMQALPDMIIAITDYFTENTPLIVEGAIRMMMGIVEAIPAIAMALIENMPAIVDAIVYSLAGSVSQVTEAAGILLEAIIAPFKDLSDKVWNALVETVNGIVQWGNDTKKKGQEAIEGFVDQVVTYLSGLPDKAWTWLEETAEKFLQWGQAIQAKAQETINGFVERVGTFLSELPGKVMYWLGYVIGTFIKWGMELRAWVETEIPKIIDSIITFFSELPEKIWTWLVGTIDRFLLWRQQIYDTAINAARETIDSVVTFFSELPDKIWTCLTDTVAKIQQWGSDIQAEAQQSANAFVESIVTFFSELPGKVWTWLVNVVTKIQAWGQQMLAKARTAINNMITAIISQLTQLPGKIASELNKATERMVKWGADIVKRMTEVGKNIVHGIWDGISSGWDWLVKKVKELADSLLDGVKDALKINSPSGAFRDEVGRQLMPGTMEGVRRSMPKTLQEMKAQAGELIAAMRGTVTASMNEIALNASGAGAGRLLTSAGTVVYNDNHQEQENNYHVPVVTPSETAKANREAFRKMAGGVK